MDEIEHTSLNPIFCHSDYFVENEKDGNNLVQGLVNMVYGVEQTSLYSIFFSFRVFCREWKRWKSLGGRSG